MMRGPRAAAKGRHRAGGGVRGETLYHTCTMPSVFLARKWRQLPPSLCSNNKLKNTGTGARLPPGFHVH